MCSKGFYARRQAWYRARTSMNATHELLPNSRIKLTVTAHGTDYAAARDLALTKLAQSAKLPGFRPGKAPLEKVAASVGADTVAHETLEQLIAVTYEAAMVQTKRNPLEGPTVHVQKWVATGVAEDEVALEYTAELDVVPEITLGAYDKLPVADPEKKEVAEAQVDEELALIRKQRAALIEVGEDATLKNGMWADIAFSGAVGGVKRDDMQAKAFPLMVGEGQLIPGFEDAMQGMKVGEERTFTVTFPKDYHASELAGNEAEFTVTLNALKDVVLPELDDEFAKQMGTEGAADLKAKVREALERQAERTYQTLLEERIIDALLEVSTLEVPHTLLHREQHRLVDELVQRLPGGSLEDYAASQGKTPEQVMEDMSPQAERNVRAGLCMGKVIEKEGMKAEGAEAIKEVLAWMAERRVAKK